MPSLGLEAPHVSNIGVWGWRLGYMILRTHQAWKTPILELNKAPLPCRMAGTTLGLCLTGTFGEVADGNLSTLRHSCIGSDSGGFWEGKRALWVTRVRLAAEEMVM